MRLKPSMNKSNSVRNLNSNETEKIGMNFNILNQNINNIDENSFDLDMDSAEVPYFLSVKEYLFIVLTFIILYEFY